MRAWPSSSETSEVLHMWYLWCIYIIPTLSKAAAIHSSGRRRRGGDTQSVNPNQVIVFALINFYFFPPVIYGAAIGWQWRAIYR